MRTIVFITSLLAAAFCAAQAPRHPFTFDDAASLHSASATAVSPDGKTVLYAVRFGGHKGPTNTEWNLIPITGGESRHLTIPEKFKPSGFTADGAALYGTTEVNGKGQLATLALAPPNTPAAAAATPVALTALPRGIHSVQISPDGKRYAVVADPRLPDPLAEVHSVIEPESNGLYVINADGKNGSWWCPALGNIAIVAWSRDGSSLAVLSQTPKIGFHFQRSFIDVCSASGARHVATIENMTGGIGWINDDKDIVFLSTTTSVLTPEHVWTVPAGGGTPTDRTPQFPASALDLSVDAHVMPRCWWHAA